VVAAGQQAAAGADRLAGAASAGALGALLPALPQARTLAAACWTAACRLLDLTRPRPAPAPALRRAWQSQGQRAGAWCARHCLKHAALLRAAGVRAQLLARLRALRVPVESCGGWVPVPAACLPSCRRACRHLSSSSSS
jgi:hypothetical protein